MDCQWTPRNSRTSRRTCLSGRPASALRSIKCLRRLHQPAQPCRRALRSATSSTWFAREAFPLGVPGALKRHIVTVEELEDRYDCGDTNMEGMLIFHKTVSVQDLPAWSSKVAFFFSEDHRKLETQGCHGRCIRASACACHGLRGGRACACASSSGGSSGACAPATTRA